VATEDCSENRLVFSGIKTEVTLPHFLDPPRLHYMDVSQPSLPNDHAISPSLPDSSPMHDYGSLGPASDVQAGSTSRRPKSSPATFLAVSAGVILALAVGHLSHAHAAWARFFSGKGETRSAPVSRVSARQLDGLKPQKQAEALLELAVSNSEGATDQISSRVDRWQGELQWDSQMATLTTAALSSNNLRVRQSGVEVELAAYGLSRNSASFDYVLRTVESSNHAQKIWGLWALGLMGYRGVGTSRAIEILTSHLKDQDEDSRHWAVDGLALVGSTDTIPILLAAMHDDSSPRVREEAACALAQSGIFTNEQRMSAVPQLLTYTDDPALDAQTHGWTFQALREITGQQLPSDATAWRAWYEGRN